jgi:hypothetical protein
MERKGETSPAIESFMHEDIESVKFGVIAKPWIIGGDALAAWEAMQR